MRAMTGQLLRRTSSVTKFQVTRVHSSCWIKPPPRASSQQLAGAEVRGWAKPFPKHKAQCNEASKPRRGLWGLLDNDSTKVLYFALRKLARCRVHFLPFHSAVFGCCDVHWNRYWSVLGGVLKRYPNACCQPRRPRRVLTWLLLRPCRSLIGWAFYIRTIKRESRHWYPSRKLYNNKVITLLLHYA